MNSQEKDYVTGNLPGRRSGVEASAGICLSPAKGSTPILAGLCTNLRRQAARWVDSTLLKGVPLPRPSFQGIRAGRHIGQFLGQQSGFTLVELLIVLIIIALLVGIVVPSVSGFLGRGREMAFRGDKRNIQISVDAYYTDSRLRTVVGGAGFSTFPTEYTGDGAPGLVTRATNVVISMPLLVNKGYMRDLPASAAPASGGEIGHYIWIIDGSTGTVYGCSGGSSGGNSTWTVTSYDTDCGYDGQYP